MAADKVYRVLSMYMQMLEGGIIDKESAAERYDVNERSIQRDIVDIREFMDKKSLQTGNSNTVVFDRSRGGYRLKNSSTGKLNKSEILAICKILLDSRAFTKKEMDALLDKVIDCCAADESKNIISELVANERFHYIEPFHRTSFINRMWDIAEAVHQRQLMEITYRRVQNNEEIRRKIKPVSVMFNDFYFYLIAYMSDQDLYPEYAGENVPITYRIDRIERYSVLSQHFTVPYSDRFEDGEFRKRATFMHGGKLKKVQFRYNGSSIETVIDHIPTAKLLSYENGVYTFSAEAFGNGIDMWLRSQGDAVEIIM